MTQSVRRLKRLKEVIAVLVVLLFGTGSALSGLPEVADVPAPSTVTPQVLEQAAPPPDSRQPAEVPQPTQEERHPEALPLRRDENRVMNAESGLARFFERVRSMEEGEIQQVSIYHLGDSHVWGGAFPMRIVQGLQDSFGDAGGSLYYTAPKKPKRAARKAKAGSIKGKKSLKTKEAQPTGKPKVKVSVVRKEKKGKKRLKAQARQVSPGSPQIRPISASPGEKGVSCSIYGIIGKTFGYFSASPVVYEHLRQNRPDLIIVTLGTNEAFSPEFDPDEFRADIDTLVSRVRGLLPDVSFLFTVPPDSFWRSGYINGNIALARGVIIDYCMRHGHAYWDLYEIMGGEGSMQGWLDAGFAGRDRVHFRKDGYSMQGELLYQAVMRAYEAYKEKAGDITEPKAIPGHSAAPSGALLN